MSSFQNFNEKWRKLNPNSSLLTPQGLYYVQHLDLEKQRGLLCREEIDDLCAALSFYSEDPTCFFLVLHVGGIPYLYTERFYTVPGNEVVVKMNRERSGISLISQMQVNMGLIFLPSREVGFCHIV